MKAEWSKECDCQDESDARGEHIWKKIEFERTGWGHKSQDKWSAEFVSFWKTV